MVGPQPNSAFKQTATHEVFHRWAEPAAIQRLMRYRPVALRGR